MFRIFLIIIVTQYLGTFAVDMEDYKIELITAMFRHGDRTPLKSETYPKDPYNSSHYEPFGYDALTNNGKMREYQIGKMLGKRYGKFLGDIYKSEYVNAYSLDLDRTIMSLQLVLAGLFPPTSEQIWNKDVYWLPAVIKSKPAQVDIFQIITSCSEYTIIWKRIRKLLAIRRQLYRYKPLLKYLSKFSGLLAEVNTATALYHTLEAQMSLDLKRPEWCTDSVFRELQEFIELIFKIVVYSDDAKKLLTGPVIKRILRNINDSNSVNKKKIYLYSVSDSQINILLHGHNFSFPLVHYGDTVILEKLRGNDDQIYIRFLYWSNIDDKWMVLKLNDCDEICPLSKYIEIVKPILPLKDGTECLYNDYEKSFKSWMDGTITGDASVPNLS